LEPEEGEFGWPCDEPDDCDSEFCVITANGQQCTETCEDSCPEGFSCRQLSATDPIFVCLPRWVKLCDPCQQASECRANGLDLGTHCVDHGASGWFCGEECDDGACPKGYSCNQVPIGQGQIEPQCVPDSGQCECSQLAKDLQLSTACTVTSLSGVCKGSRTCAADGLSACSALEPTPEVCNGLDDDCNDVPDDLTQGYPCFKENSHGKCLGSGTCIQAVELCDAKAAEPETCDGLDNDCDSSTDEGSLDTDLDGQADCIDEDDDGDSFPDLGDNCPLTPNPNQESHDSDPQGDACDADDDNDNAIDEVDCEPFNPNIYPGAAEVCDGIDNDCNDATDDNLCSDANPCTSDACQADGSCVHTPVSGSCDDGTACTESDTCLNGTCTGTVKTCDDSIPCTTNGCDPVKGCSNLLTANLECDDGSPCTAQDKCDAQGLCTGKLDNTLCDDGNLCTVDSCNSMLVQPCVHEPTPEGKSCASTGIPVGQCQEAKCVDGICMAQSGNEGKGCTTGNSTCPQGSCSNGICFSKSGQTCLYKGDFCEDDVPGQCASKGECVPNDDPSCTCTACSGICVCCYVFGLPFAFCFPL
jgi:hypothetical protein